ncbi:DNA repair protein RecO [Rickettsia prowazekii]|uniref:DNA repair protein RecO n=1 Tax=Rickettsia prowazekii (strain Rp22) TaxID=449216 RepID=D5AXD9_RICPP|nr:DNA repair protein RecO [Rickettsia prowazekii]ADE30078.1 DNA repair protein RecO [Rickettsia prowazekii str. Rp22]AFE49352.1 DNA repair protein RecO [Rickettsia prowazekii str. Chernikova]AFE50196.1 DNA repair protein RecO [Rickettsia prowazekii str. Katsinyian]AFE51042.1 DNA repair protein RecO [Rickettsia prowazekii str. BuV67-CWPP]AFE51878.1 DNA repair protein RecO [Rickettsia prowazekii str. Dachau]
MNIKDIGVIISKKPLKENTFIIRVFTKNHGLYSGVIKESSKKNKFIYQEGNIVDFLWKARLHEHIGIAKCELIKSYTGYFIINKAKLYAFNSVISLIQELFHEREEHSIFFSFLINYLDNLSKNFCFRDYISFELNLLAETGYKLDLTKCCVSHVTTDLTYVSPKSARALSYKVGKPYRDKLLILPKFLLAKDSEITLEEKKQALTLTNYFFNRYLFHNNRQVKAREEFIEYITNI